VELIASAHLLFRKSELDCLLCTYNYTEVERSITKTQRNNGSAFCQEIMGNVQCGLPRYGDTTFLDSKQKGASSISSRLCFATGSHQSLTEASNDSFLSVHQEDLPQKCIMDPKEVIKALKHQAEEMIRREKLKQEDDVASLLDEGDDDEVASRDRTSSIYAHSEAAPTEVTSGSAATRPVGNHGKVSAVNRKKNNRNRLNRPPQMKGKQFQLMENFNDDIQSVLTSATYGTVGGKPSAIAQERLRSMERRHELFAARPETSCSILSIPCIEDFSDTVYARKAKVYMSTLHLKVKPQCPQYYEERLSFVELGKPTIRAGSQDIPISNLTPPRNKRGTAALGGPSAVYSGFGLEFGEGPPSSPVQLMVSEASFMDLAITGSLGLVDRPRSRPLMSSPPRKQLKSPAHFLVLLNQRSGIPLAVCSLKAASTGPPVVRIYTTKQRVFGQRPAASTRKLGLDWSESLPLYTWAEIVTEGRIPDNLKYSIFMASGSNGHFEDTPSYRAAHDANGDPIIRMVGRTEQEDSLSGCAVISLSRDEVATEGSGIFFHLAAARGIDPALLICFTALVDEVMEKAMRTC
jgi:hypothetical protein